MVALTATLSSSAPQRTLSEIQKIVDEGGFKHYPGLVTKHRVPKAPYVLGANLSVGSVAPVVTDPDRLLRSAHKKQVVKVSGPTSFCYPIYEELARQNGVSCDIFMDHIEVRWDNDKNDGRVFSPEIDVMSVVEAVLPAVSQQAAEETRKENSENRRDRIQTEVRTRSDEAKEVFRLKTEEGTIQSRVPES